VKSLQSSRAVGGTSRLPCSPPFERGMKPIFLFSVFLPYLLRRHLSFLETSNTFFFFEIHITAPTIPPGFSPLLPIPLSFWRPETLRLIFVSLYVQIILLFPFGSPIFPQYPPGFGEFRRSLSEPTISNRRSKVFPWRGACAMCIASVVPVLPFSRIFSLRFSSRRVAIFLRIVSEPKVGVFFSSATAPAGFFLC